MIGPVPSRKRSRWRRRLYRLVLLALFLSLTAWCRLRRLNPWAPRLAVAAPRRAGMTVDVTVRDAAFWNRTLAYKRLGAAAVGRRTNVTRPNPARHLWRVPHEATTQSRRDDPFRPLVAIVTSTTSKGRVKEGGRTRWTDVALVQHLIPSLYRTVNSAEQGQWRVHLYVAVDQDDTWWRKHWSRLRVQNAHWLNITFGVFASRPGRIPFSEMAYVAYEQGAEYFCRVNDDTEFISSGWITLAVTALSAPHPQRIPNVGVVAPTCAQGNTDIWTHDFVHRTHLDIFDGHYYPSVLDNWFVDDWMTHVYSSEVWGGGTSTHSRRLPDWHVTHWIQEQRYTARELQGQWLPYLYADSRQRMVDYLHRLNQSLTLSLVPRPPIHVEPDMVQALQAVLPRDGNLLMWGGLNRDCHYWHVATTGAVVVLDDSRNASYTRDVVAWYPYLHTERVQRGDHGNTCSHVLLSDSVRHTPWHVVWIQGARVCAAGPPDGVCHASPRPGEWDPLDAMHQLVQAQQRTWPDHTTHVWVDNFHRRYERALAHVLWGPPVRVWSGEGDTEYAHFVVGADMDEVVLNDTWCAPPHPYKLTPNLVAWRNPIAAEVASSSMVQSPITVWIILLHVNDGYYDFALNWLGHYTRLNGTIPVVIVAEDDVVYAKLTHQVVSYQGNITVTRSQSTMDSSVLAYDTPAFHALVSHRPTHLRHWLEQGLGVIYTDVDTVWRANPIPYLALTSHGVDLVAAVQATEHWGLSPYYSTGLMAMASNPRTIALVTKWGGMLQEEPALNIFAFGVCLKQSNVLHQPLPETEFPKGDVYFSNATPAQRARAVVVHTTGMDVEEKKSLLERHGLWRVP